MSDMRNDLDELGGRLWPNVNALRPAGATPGSGGGGGRPRRRWELLATVAAALLVVAVIGGAVLLGRSRSSPQPAPAGPTPTQPVSSVSASPSAPNSPSPSPTAVPAPHVIVWAVAGPTSTVIRAGTVSGGFHTVGTIPTGPTPSILGAGGHRVLFWRQSNGHVYDLDINTGTVTDRGGAGGDRFFGAAFSPDGTRVEYLRLSPQNMGQILLLDFVSGATTGLQSSAQQPMDVPRVWTADGIAASRQYLPYTDASDAGFALLDPATGARFKTTNAQMRPGAWAISPDGVHAAHAVGVPPGQPDPGVLDTEVIGSAPQVALREDTNHVIDALAVSPDGSTVLFSDQPSMGGFAGISLSPSYGLFTISGGRRIQVAHYGQPGSGPETGAFVDATDFLVASTGGGQATLLHSAGGRSLTTLDTAAGTYVSFVGLVTGQ
jgi:hypothetical protein